MPWLCFRSFEFHDLLTSHNSGQCIIEYGGQPHLQLKVLQLPHLSQIICGDEPLIRTRSTSPPSFVSITTPPSRRAAATSTSSFSSRSPISRSGFTTILNRLPSQSASFDGKCASSQKV